MGKQHIKTNMSDKIHPLQNQSFRDVNIIGVTGRKYSGKDTVGKYFIKNYGFERLSLADPLKEACRHIFGFTNDQLHGDKKEIVDTFWQVTPRKIFQYVGTDLLRNKFSEDFPSIGTDLWIKSLERKITNSLDNGTKVVVTDLRFQNEIDMIKKLGGIVIRTNRNGLNRSNDFSNTHESEINIDKFAVDFDIYNDGTIEELYSWITDNICKKNICDKTIC